MEFWGGLAFTYLPLKRFYKYLLKRLVGSFLRHDIDLEHLEVQLYRGIVQLKALELDVSQFNMAVASAGFCMHFVSGIVGTIKMDIPWRHLLSEHCKIYIDGVDLVLSKGFPADQPSVSPFGVVPHPSAASPREGQAPSMHDSGGTNRYSDEGIQTLSRLVKHVLARTEACFHNTSVSLVAPAETSVATSAGTVSEGTQAESRLRAQVSSVVVFSEKGSSMSEAGAVSLVEARSVRVSGVNVSMIRPGAGLPTGSSRTQLVEESMPSSADGNRQFVLLSTDAPDGCTSVPGELLFRRLQEPVVDSGLSTRGLGTHLELELILPSLRIALAPSAYTTVAFCLSLFCQDMRCHRNDGDESASERTSIVPEQGNPFGSHRGPSMVQSLMESSITGRDRHAGFWHELYNLFEADSQLEDAAGRGGDATDGWDENGGEEDETINASALTNSAGTAAEDGAPGPLLGYTIRVNIMRIGVVLVIGDDSSGSSGPIDVKLSPGPATGVFADQVQLCVANWELDFNQQLCLASDDHAGEVSRQSPVATVLVRTAALHLHRYRPQELHHVSNTSQNATAAASASAALNATVAAAMATSAASRSDSAAALAAHSRSSVRVDVDPAMFSSAMSTAPAVLGAASFMPQTVVEEMERQSSHGSTAESFGGSDVSGTASFASSLHSFDSVSDKNSPRRRDADSHAESLFASVREDNDIAEMPAAAFAQAHAAQRDDSEPRSAWVPGEAQSDVESDIEGQAPQELRVPRRRPRADADDLEVQFFNRKHPIHEVLLESRRQEVDMEHVESVVDGVPEWHESARDFSSKRMLHFIVLTWPPEDAVEGNATGQSLVMPRLSLPPARHPIWHGLRLTGREATTSSPGSCCHKIRFDFGGDIHPLSDSEISSSRTPFRIECQPIVISLCSHSIHSLVAGASRFEGLVSPQMTAPSVPHTAYTDAVEGVQLGSFNLAAVVPLVRMKLELGSSEEGPCTIVTDLIAPRLFTEPSAIAAPEERVDAALDGSYTESLRVEVADVAAYLLGPVAGGSDSHESDLRAEANDESTTSSPTICKNILSIDGSWEECNVKCCLSMFRKSPRCNARECEASSVDGDQQGQEVQAAPASENPTPTLSDWTKISEAEGPPSKSSMMLQDLRDVSQRFMRPSHGTRGIAAGGPTVLLPRGRAEFDLQCDDVGRESNDTKRAYAEHVGGASSSTGMPTSYADRSYGVRASHPSSGSCLMQECDYELKMVVPQTVHLHFDGPGFEYLREACSVFAADYALLSMREASAIHGTDTSQPDDAPMLPPRFGGTLRVERVLFDVLEGDAPAQEQLHLSLSPIHCRFLYFQGSRYKLCMLGQDLRLESLTPIRGLTEQLIRPWFRPIFYTPTPERGGRPAPSSRFSSAAGYPWEIQSVEHCTSVVYPIFYDIEEERWRDTHSVLIEVEQQDIEDSNHTDVSLTLSRLAFNVQPHIDEVYKRLVLFLNPSEYARNYIAFVRMPQKPAYTPCDAIACKVSVLDCLVDLPSDGYAQSWPITSPRGLEVPTLRPTTRGPDGDKWRAIVHVGGLDISWGTFISSSTQDLKICASSCNIFLVDHPSHLSYLDIVTTSSQPLVFLSSLGFAHILELSGASAMWRSGDVAYDSSGRTRIHESASSTHIMNRQALDVEIGSLSGHVCADTLKCLLCVGMEVVENVNSYSSPLQLRKSDHVPIHASRIVARVAEGDAYWAGAGSRQQKFASDGHAEESACSSEPNILSNIDMYAFDSASSHFSSAVDEAYITGGSSGSTAPLEAHMQAAGATLEGCLIEDYIRAQQEQQARYSSNQAQSPSPPPVEMVGPCGARELDMLDIDAWVASEGVEAGAGAQDLAASSSSIAVCLLDPEAYSPQRLKELCLQDRTARHEIEELYMEELRPLELEQTGAAYTAERATARVQPRTIRQDGSAATWLIDPADFMVVQDHFSSDVVHVQRPSEKVVLVPPARLPPTRIVATVNCNVVQLSLYGGTDFADDAQSKLHTRTALPEVKTAHLTLQLQQGIFKYMDFFAPDMFSDRSCTRDDNISRKLVVRARDFGILDRVQSSVYSHLLSYYDDEHHRPRQNDTDMVHLHIEELSRPLCSMPVAAASSHLPSDNTARYRVDLRLLPLRLTVDQDVVEFLMDFVQLCTLPTYVEEEPGSPLDSHDGAADSEESVVTAIAGDEDPTSHTVDTDDACVFFEAVAEAAEESFPTAATAEELQCVATVDSVVTGSPAQPSSDVPASTQQSYPTIFQRVTISALLLSVDYRAKRLDVGALRRGELWELVNLLPLLEGLEVAFRRVAINDVEGVHEVLAQVGNAWSADLNRTQILRSLTGVTPIRSFANIGGSFADMVLQPLKQYRAGKGPQRVSSALLHGLVSFMKHVTVESIELTERIFMGTQSALEYVNACWQEPQQVADAPARTMPLHGLTSADAGPHGISQNWTPVERGAGYYMQPGSASEGLQQASTNLTRGIRQAGQAVVGRPLLELQRGASKEKVLQSIVSGIPICVLRPAIGATAAAATALRGLRNSVDPVRRREGERKYKEPE